MVGKEARRKGRRAQPDSTSLLTLEEPVIVRRLAFPGIHLGNPPLIDPKVGGDIMLELARGEPAADFQDCIIVEWRPFALWPCRHLRNTFRIRPGLTGSPRLWDTALNSGKHPVTRLA